MKHLVPLQVHYLLHVRSEESSECQVQNEEDKTSSSTWNMNTATKETNACIRSVQCSPEKFHVNGSLVLLFSLE